MAWLVKITRSYRQVPWEGTLLPSLLLHQKQISKKWPNSTCLSTSGRRKRSCCWKWDGRAWKVREFIRARRLVLTRMDPGVSKSISSPLLRFIWPIFIEMVKNKETKFQFLKPKICQIGKLWWPYPNHPNLATHNLHSMIRASEPIHYNDYCQVATAAFKPKRIPGFDSSLTRQYHVYHSLKRNSSHIQPGKRQPERPPPKLENKWHKVSGKWRKLSKNIPHTIDKPTESHVKKD